MTKTYTLKGLNCASCAAKIERSVRALEGINAVTLNPVTAILNVEFSDKLAGQITKLIEDIVRRYEPDVEVVASSENKSSHVATNDTRLRIIRLIAGATVFAAAIIIETFFAAKLLAWISSAIFTVAYLILGANIILRALKKIIRGQFFDENFLMSVATIGAFIIGKYPEAVAVMLFYQIGEFFQEMAVNKSKKSISALMNIRPDYANLLRGSEETKVDPNSVNIGEIIIVKPGEKIPLDGEVVEGEAMLDTSALTGESVPRKAKLKDTVLSGCINLNGVLIIKVTKTFGHSTVAKIIDLVENASSKKAPTENFITTFCRYYTPVVVGLAALIAVAPPLLGYGDWADWVHRGLVFLVISCPCALVISIPLGFFGGIGGASRKGVLVKGSNYLEALNALDIVVFDKTGTLTKGVFKVTGIQTAGNCTEEELLEFAAKAESFSNHPIALSILKAYSDYDREIDKSELSEYSEVSGHGVSVRANGKTILVGSHKLMAANNISFAETQEVGTKVYVAIDNLFAGSIVISDEIKQDSKAAIAALKAHGIRKTVMLTGDNQQIAAAIAKELNLDECHAGLLPHEKVEKVEQLLLQKQPKGKLAFVGDGINDAPVLARADVGIAMGGLGSDAAIEAADAVLMTDEPAKLVDAISVASFTKRVVWQNIVFALGIKGLFLILGALGVASMWEAVFADVGVALLAILNASRVIKGA
ncbi:MAG: cadmium-translocating P-type ATPase [Spirochaetes bacterium]|nr:cadmium-translocating P-type ATPase [Spirochaetota bacterium]